MPRDVRKFLLDIERVCTELRSRAERMSFDEYADSRDQHLMIERLLEILTEALRRAAQLDPSITMRFTHFREIADFRNVLVHAYWRIDDDAIWEILHHDIPSLHAEVRALLAEHP